LSRVASSAAAQARHASDEATRAHLESLAAKAQAVLKPAQ
jgi:hypothetical protein